MNTWKPTVTPVGSFDIRHSNKAQSMEPQIFTKTSLAKNPEVFIILYQLLIFMNYVID